MKTKSILITMALFMVALLAKGQAYKKDLRPPEKKQDPWESFQSDRINQVHLLKALELSGIRIFNFPLKPFDKTYKMEVYLAEYVGGVKVKDATNIYPNYSGDNTYRWSGEEDDDRHSDYIESITFYTKENDSTSILKLETYAMQFQTVLKQKKIRKDQFYNWRSYSKTDWILNKEIPLLVYASSWYDEKYKIERFCGVVDLSGDETETKELLYSSPHYYVITYKIVE